jgi:hypothetical protein
MSTNDECYTPKWIFTYLNLEFDLDVAAPETETYVPAKTKFTKKMDGLAQNWEGLIWMNPPYSETTNWVRKFIKHNNGIALVPFTKSKWFQELWDTDASVIPLPPNLKFINGLDNKFQIQYQTALWALGDQAKEALKNFEIRRR